jgi:hypothetical protein
MKVELHEIKIKDVVKDYKDSAEEGVTAYGGKLDIHHSVNTMGIKSVIGFLLAVFLVFAIPNIFPNCNGANT